MTDEELDRARSHEALRRFYQQPAFDEPATTIAARLGRMNWTPPDPIGKEIDAILGPNGHPGSNGRTTCLSFSAGHTVALIRKALERGIEIGKGR